MPKRFHRLMRAKCATHTSPHTKTNTSLDSSRSNLSVEPSFVPFGSVLVENPSFEASALWSRCGILFAPAMSREELMIVRLSMDLLPRNLHRRKRHDLGFPTSHRWSDSAKYLSRKGVPIVPDLATWSFSGAKVVD